jgi:hypothetical protein
MSLDQDIARIAAIEDMRARAIIEADTATLERITASDYVHIEASGQRRDRQGFLAGIDPTRGRFERYLLLENDIRILGDAALVIGVFENVFVTATGERRTRRARHTRVYVRGGQDWLNLSHQATILD